MIRRRVAAALAGLAATAPLAATAGPRVDLDRCAMLDRVALRRAIEGELAGAVPDAHAAVADRVVVIECPDAITAHLRVEPAPPSGPIARSVDLGEVPGPLRARLIALAVVELVDVAAVVTAAAAAAAPTAAATDPAARSPAAPDRPSGIDPTPLGPGALPPTTVAAIAPPADAGVAAGVDRPRRRAAMAAPRRALGDRGGLLAGRAIAPRVGIRVYPSGAVPMAAVAVDLVQGAFAVGVTAAVGRTVDPLGTVTPLLVAGTAGATVACGRTGAFEACASARVTAGLAGATATAADPATPAQAATAPYLELGGQLELAWRGTRGAVAVVLDAGWAEGLVITAGPREVAHLDGAIVAASIGARF